MTNFQAFQNSLSKLLIHPLLWRLTGFISSIVGFLCFALSPSFKELFGHWNPLKIVIYCILSSVISILMLLVKRCNWGFMKSFLMKAHVGFLVLTLTSLCSFLEDRREEGKVETLHGKIMNLSSTGAFALMALSLSRQLELGFEVGVFNFLIGCFLVTVMKMSLKLAPVAALLCYVLVNIRSVSDFVLEMRGGDGHGDRGTESNEDDDEGNECAEDEDEDENEDDGWDPHYEAYEYEDENEYDDGWDPHDDAYDYDSEFQV